MKKVFCLLLMMISNVVIVSAQRGFNYYKDSSRVGSPNEKAYSYFKKAYYDHIWNWTREDADSAEHYLKLAIKEDPSYAAAYAFLAHVYQFKTYDGKDLDKKFALQKQYAEKALSFHPKTGDAYSVMSDVKWEERDTSAALHLLREAIAMEPDNVGNYIFLAIRLTQMQSSNDSAIYYLHRLIQLDPEYGQAYIKMGNIHSWNTHRYDSAKFYYRKAIDVYNNVKPRDNRMMDAYYWLGELYKSEKKFDSAIFYYNALIKEMEPSKMYIREMRLGQAYKALYDCHRELANNQLARLVKLSEEQIAKNPGDAKFLFGILQENYKPIAEDSITEKYALPLARRIQAIPSSDPYSKVFAVYEESLLLTRLKRKNEAMKVLEKYLAEKPKEPLILFELGRIKILGNDTKAGLAYLMRAKQNLNHIVTKEAFLYVLKEPDFDKVRNTNEFKKLTR